MDKLVRRTFSIDDTPLYLERFKNEKICLLEMDDDTLVEYMQGFYYSFSFDDTYTLIDRIKLG